MKAKVQKGDNMEDKIIMTLTSETGEQVDYELMDVVSLNNNIYSVFYPTKEGETEVVICRVEDIPGTDNSQYIMETDPAILNEVYQQFKTKYIGKIFFDDNK